MAENNNTETSSDGSTTQQGTEDNQDAQLLDDLTVLSRDESEPETARGEALSGTSVSIDDGGYENLQSSISLDGDRKAAQVDEGDIRKDSLNIDRSVVDVGVEVPPNPSDSEGHKDPVPFLDQPLPAAEIDFNQQPQEPSDEPSVSLLPEVADIFNPATPATPAAAVADSTPPTAQRLSETPADTGSITDIFIPAAPATDTTTTTPTTPTTATSPTTATTATTATSPTTATTATSPTTATTATSPTTATTAT
ncbi:MAG: hypothetical protein PSV18_13940, partial [Methylobacter sp.]|nr:hypothetical protein [Candidatus Methylobacter titanis]